MLVWVLLENDRDIQLFFGVEDSWNGSPCFLGKGVYLPAKLRLLKKSHVLKGAHSTVSTEADVRASILSKIEPISNIFYQVLEREHVSNSFKYFFFSFFYYSKEY